MTPPSASMYETVDGVHDVQIHDQDSYNRQKNSNANKKNKAYEARSE